MRTTIILDDLLVGRLKKVVSKRRLSRFVNRCLREHFEAGEREKRLRELEKAYQRVSKKLKSSQDWETLDSEEWPEW